MQKPPGSPWGSRRERPPVRLIFQDGGQRFRDGLARKGPLPGKTFEEDADDGPDVSTLVDVPVGGMLGAHVVCGSQDHTGLGQPDVNGVGVRLIRVEYVPLRSLGQSEVQHLHRAFRGQLDIGGLPVAVDDAFSGAASSSKAICRRTSRALPMGSSP